MAERSKFISILDRVLVITLVLFFGLHMANHLAIVGGAGVHIAIMDGLRHLYRFPIFEVLLIGAVIWQVRAGIKQLRRFPLSKVRGKFRVLTVSGLYLIAFLVIHMGAVYAGRIFAGLDTNLYFAAAGYRVSPFMLFFYPYYFLAVWAGFAHLGSVLWLRKRADQPALADRTYWGAILFGLIAALIISFGISGALAPFDVPDLYLDNYR